jgi:hypothetical protein
MSVGWFLDVLFVEVIIYTRGNKQHNYKNTSQKLLRWFQRRPPAGNGNALAGGRQT